MRSGPPENENSGRTPAALMTKALLALAGVAILAFSLAMAYHERGNPQAPAQARKAAYPPDDKAGLGFNLYAQPRALPLIRFSDGNGRTRSLADFRGKVVLLNIWATWCVPCRKEMPTLDRLQAKLGGPGFEVVALAIDDDGLPAVQEFYMQTGIKRLRVYLDKRGEALSNLGVTGIPTTLLIDREGREVGRKLGPAEWDSPAAVKLIRGYLGAPAQGGGNHRSAFP